MNNKKTIFGWVMYDWANSAFATVIMAAVLPTFYSSIAAPHIGDNTATAYWGYTNSIAMLLIAVVAPILGATADFSRSKKKFLTFFIFLGAITTSFLYFAGDGDYILISVLFIIGMIGFSGANIFYDAFLPEIVPLEKMDYISAKGYSYGYLGGGLLLLINIMMILNPSIFGIPSTMKATQLSFLSVGVWWLIFSIPIFKYVHEDRSDAESKKVNALENNSYMTVGLKRVLKTIRDLKQYKELMKFLIAFWLYNDGISTIIKMATIYGSEIGIDTKDLITALLVTQFVGFPFALLFGKFAGKIGSKKALYVALWTYVLITIFGYFMQTATHFFILAVVVGFVQGGSQAISRSIFGSMVPKKKTAEFFGFYSISSKFAAIFGPLLFAIVSQLTDSSRNAIFSLIIFFLVGLWLLSRVDIEKGQLESGN